MSNGINMTTKSVKAINFDIKQELLDRYYEKSNSMAYYDINKFLKDRGFEHRQGSGYISKDAMTVNDVLSIIYDMNEELPWTLICIEKIDITEKYTEIQDENYINNRLDSILVFEEILSYGKYKANGNLVRNMLIYKDLTGEVPDLSNLSYLYIAEENEALKDIILEIKTECESQDIERQVEKYIAQSLDEDIEKDIELDEDLEI